MRPVLLAIGLSITTPALATTVPINLTAGRDYALVLVDGLTSSVTDPTGKVVARMDWQGDPFGVEFRAQFTATYFVHYPDGSDVIVPLDCASNTATHCLISVNHTKTATLWWEGATDWRKIKLVGGYTYDVIVTEEFNQAVYATFVSGNHMFPMPFKAPRTGTYYLQLLCDNLDGGCRYTATVRIIAKP